MQGDTLAGGGDCPGRLLQDDGDGDKDGGMVAKERKGEEVATLFCSFSPVHVHVPSRPGT